jgi:hypothetical protein
VLLAVFADFSDMKLGSGWEDNRRRRPLHQMATMTTTTPATEVAD